MDNLPTLTPNDLRLMERMIKVVAITLGLLAIMAWRWWAAGMADAQASGAPVL
jgi:hypothetical protein